MSWSSEAGRTIRPTVGHGSGVDCRGWPAVGRARGSRRATCYLSAGGVTSSLLKSGMLSARRVFSRSAATRRSVAFSFGQGDMTRWQRLDGALRRCSFFTLLLFVGLQVTAGRCCHQLTMSYGTVRRAREASDGRDMANQLLEWLWRVLAAVCVLLERERKEKVFAFAWTGKEEGSCFCKCRQEHVAGQ